MPYLVTLSALPQHPSETLTCVDVKTKQSSEGSSTHNSFWDYIKALTRFQS